MLAGLGVLHEESELKKRKRKHIKLKKKRKLINRFLFSFEEVSHKKVDFS